jgi:hypothetical protein
MLQKQRDQRVLLRLGHGVDVVDVHAYNAAGVRNIASDSAETVACAKEQRNFRVQVSRMPRTLRRIPRCQKQSNSLPTRRQEQNQLTEPVVRRPGRAGIDINCISRIEHSYRAPSRSGHSKMPCNHRLSGYPSNRSMVPNFSQSASFDAKCDWSWGL